MKKFPVALQLYSVRWEMEKDFEGTLEKIRDMGFDGVEFAGFFDRDPAQIKTICEKLGLTPISAHVPTHILLEDATQILADCKSLGCRYVVIPYLASEYLPGNEKYSKFVKAVTQIGERAREMGMPLLYHNHDFEFAKLGERYLLDIIYQDISPKYLETEIDTCWVNVAGEDPAAYIRSYTGRAPLVHLKDFAGRKSDKMYALIGIDVNDKNVSCSFQYRPLGQGLQNIPLILSAASDADASWLVIEQDNPTPGIPNMDGIKMSIDYLKSIDNEDIIRAEKENG